jgi:cell division protein ZapA
MPTELIPINITIGDRTYRIKILPSDEEAVRKSLKQINDKIVEFRAHFSGKDMQDYISMVLIWFATQQSDEKLADIHKNDLLENIRKIEKQLDSIIS